MTLVKSSKDKAIEKDEEEELRAGWTMEVKKRKTGSEARVDRYYMDPVTGYIFRSLKDAQQYLKTQELGRLAIKPKNSECVDMDNKSELLYGASALMHHHHHRHHHRPRHATRLAGIIVDAPQPQPSPLMPEPKTRRATRLSGVAIDVPPPSPSVIEPKTLASPPAPKTRQAARQTGIEIDSPPPSPRDSKTRQAKPLAGREVVPSPPSQPEPKT
ncbi:hypothetical protein L1987_24016 [Smallanthus sonchifolius]|uniref:Uncharacterized protein n=1 Tax=Smallanthus sonchifolius TaxID=185202 RepID=A0ACB9IIJ4_9ASTR|nr:hypothetical protein L1987_24016 [Smallanthus sonchifolius]